MTTSTEETASEWPNPATRVSLRIALTSYYLPSESKIGAGWVSHRLANALVHLGHDVTVFSPCAKPDDAHYHHSHIMLRGNARTVKWSLAVKHIDYSSFDGLLASGRARALRRWRRQARRKKLSPVCTRNPRR